MNMKQYDGILYDTVPAIRLYEDIRDKRNTEYNNDYYYECSISDSDAQYEFIEILLDPVAHSTKPVGKEIARITGALPTLATYVSVADLARYINKGYSIKTSIMGDTKKDSFISSNMVAIDIDNRDDEKYITIDEFLVVSTNAGLYPFMIYETFSSTTEKQRFRVIYKFRDTLYDSKHIDNLYRYVWDLLLSERDMDIDTSVDYSKILFGGKGARIFITKKDNIIPGSVYEVKSTIKLPKKPVKRTEKTPVDVIEKCACDDKADSVSELREALAAMKDDYEGMIVASDKPIQWINKNVLMSDVLDRRVADERFRCILPGHEDKHPSARIDYDKDSGEQIYYCSCSGSGYRFIDLYCATYNVSRVSAMKEILGLLGLSCGSGYQRRAKEYISDLYDYYEELVDEELGKYLRNRALEPMYLLLLRIARKTITDNPVSKNSKNICFYVSGSYVKNQMVKEGLSGASNARDKINELCRLGFIRKLRDEEINSMVLRKAKEIAAANNTHKHVDFYELLDLNPEVIDSIKKTIKHDKEVGYRQYGTNAQRKINCNGSEYIENNVHVQGHARKNNEVDVVMGAVNNLIERLGDKHKVFSEEDISKEMRRMNHKINKKQAEKYILNAMPFLVESLELERVRVNKAARKRYKISKAYLSNSYVYVYENKLETLLGGLN